MKKLIAFLLAMLLLTGCTQNPAPTEPVETQHAVQLPEVTDPVPVAKLVKLNEEGLTDEEILAQRRDTVEAQMRHMMGMLWTPAEDITYRHNDYDFTLQKGRVYRGMPYSHGSGSGYSWLQYATGQDENGVYTISIDGKLLTGESGQEARISNDCADAVFWAWASVANSITFPYTQKMSTFTGCIKVGDYQWDDMGKFDGSTKPILQANGEQVMFKAFGQLQKGDGMVLYTKSSGGHAVMVCESVVVMDGDRIDGEKSYVRILEQESAGLNAEETYYEALIDGKCYVACGYDEIWTFNTIYNKGYLPITCKELIDPAPLQEQKVEDSITDPSEENMFRGQLTANYRISHATYTVYDAQGSAVRQLTCFGREESMFKMDMYRFNDILEMEYAQGSLDLESLPGGTYKCVLTCQISTGSIFEVRSFDITR